MRRLPKFIKSKFIFSLFLLTIILLFINNPVSSQASEDLIDDWNSSLPVNEVITVSNAPEKEFYPNIWDKHLVWQKFIGTQWYLMHSDLETGVVSQLVSMPGSSPVIGSIYGNLVAWTGTQDNNTRIFLTNIETNQTEIVPQATSVVRSQFSPRIWGNKLAFTEASLAGGHTVYVYNLDNLSLSKLTLGATADT